MLITLFLICGIAYFISNTPLKGVFMTFGAAMIVIFITSWNKPLPASQTPAPAISASVTPSR